MSNQFVIFDFDGVIVDSFAVAYGFYERYAPGQMTADVYRTWFNGNIFKAESKSQIHSQLPPVDVCYTEYRQRLLPIAPQPHIARTIDKLSSHYALSILSSNRLDVIDPYLREHKLRQYFDEILDCDASRSKVEKLQMLLRDHDAQPADTIFITDTLGDILEAAEVGVQCIGVTWGFHTRIMLEPGKPLAIIDNPSQIVTAVDQHFAANKN